MIFLQQTLFNYYAASYSEYVLKSLKKLFKIAWTDKLLTTSSELFYPPGTSLQAPQIQHFADIVHVYKFRLPDYLQIQAQL